MRGGHKSVKRGRRGAGDVPLTNGVGRRSRGARRRLPARLAAPPVALRRAPGRRWWCSARTAARSAWWGSPGTRPYEFA